MGPPTCNKCGAIDYSMWEKRYKIVPLNEDGKDAKELNEIEWRILTSTIEKKLNGIYSLKR